MARTVESLISEARFHLQDTVEPYRYDAASLLLFLNSGIREAKSKRPDFFYDTVFDDLDDVSTGTLGLDSQLELPLVYFVVGSAQLRDDEFAEDSRAIGMLNVFRSTLNGKPR